ncbi:GNAT family N-acetyltransferase [Catenuloplanes atrovinosus]|uniref:GNAT superfamily N-acetyltransferase n=1 Tax=Catenuloplanes atrovinosus TaxID=137266 RepID=A0AAE3YQH4_9ACTN|nr:GNAT family N-acetyltransferase [Catenuloplanes atrovinosus]MDR7277805.1 GNAT superfamily N-acetyltransferase [Catenuloplanes atrovinosus]
MADISLLPADSAADAALVAEVTALVNEVYATGEKGIWRDEAARTDAAEIASFIRAGEIAVARLGPALVGAVRVRRLPGGEGEFGMLAAHPGHRGTGIGRDLVAFAEDWARGQGLAVMQLELLYPTEWEHPVKAFLRDWYTRSGYRIVHKADFAEAYPALAPKVATPCDFLVFHKAL